MPRAPRLARPLLRPVLPLLLPLLLPAALATGPVPSARAEDPVPGLIAWHRRLPEAFDLAAKEKKPLFVAIVSERVDGGRVEPAGKELRENTYRDPRVVEASRRFVCAYLTSEGSSDDFGELRLRYAIEGLIVSPQHIFAHPDGTLISRHEYWPYGYGENAVKAMLDLMDKALRKDRAARDLPADPAAPAAPGGGEAPAPSGPPPPPEGGEARAAWVAERVARVKGGDPDARREALDRLLATDADGSALAAVLACLPDLRKDVGALADVARALGRPGLEAAVPALLDLLDHKDDAVRGNAAVSLEYVGSKASADTLHRAAPRERDETIANHMYRALGRCGAPEERTRELLAKKVSGAKSEGASFGPIVGLAYFEKDAKAAREVEKMIAKEGPPSYGRRGGGQGNLKRAFLLWCLAEIADPKSEKFIREEMITQVNPNEPFATQRLDFYEAAAKVCAGDEAAKGDVNAAMERLLGWAPAPTLKGEAREGRDGRGFTPKAEWGGAGGPPGGAPPGGGPPGKPN